MIFIKLELDKTVYAFLIMISYLPSKVSDNRLGTQRPMDRGDGKGLLIIPNSEQRHVNDSLL